MKYKVLITTSGIGQRLGDLTKYTNQTLIRVGKKPALSYIIESYPQDVPLVITTGYFGNHVRDFVKLAYPNRKIQFIKITKYEGVGASLAHSLIQAKKYLNCPFIFHAGDTIIEGQVPLPNKNWIGGHRGEDSSQYRSWNVLDNDHLILNEKGAVNFDYLHIGLVGIKDFKVFWDHLQRLYRNNPEDNTLGDCPVLVTMIRAQHKFTVVNFDKWYDIGNTGALAKTKVNIDDHFHNLNKTEESIFLLNDQVIKFFHDPQMVKDRVKRAQLLKGLVPKHLGSAKHFYSYEYMPGELYARVVTPNDFKKFLAWTKQNLWLKKNRPNVKKFKELCLNFYREKTQKRVTQFLEMHNLSDESQIINGETVPTLKDLLGQVDFDQLAEAEPYQFHGDLILDNIIKTKTGYCLIDWRQHFAGLYKAGDMYYDLAKLNHNLIINHDIVHQNLVTIESDRGVIKCDILRPQNLVECQKVLMDFIQVQGYNLKKVEFLTSIIWLNMAPLHHYPFNLFLFYFGKLNLWRTIKKYQ